MIAPLLKDLRGAIDRMRRVAAWSAGVSEAETPVPPLAVRGRAVLTDGIAP